MPNITTKKNKIQHVAEVRPHFTLASREKKKKILSNFYWNYEGSEKITQVQNFSKIEMWGITQVQ